MKKLMKALAFGAAGMLITSVANAQAGSITIGAHAGVAVSKLCCAGMAVNEDYAFKGGAAFGLTGAYGVNRWLSVTAELNYANQGGEKNGMQAVGISGSTAYANFNNKLSLGYLELPVMVRATLGGKHFKYYANAGIFAGYLLSAYHQTSGRSPLYTDAAGQQPLTTEAEARSFDQEHRITGDLNSLNFGLVGGLGLGYTSGKHGIWIDGRYALGMPNIYRKKDIIGENSTGSIIGLIGYTYTLR